MWRTPSPLPISSGLLTPFCRTYLGKHWPSLSANPMNDIKDVGSLLHKAGSSSSLLMNSPLPQGGYSTENTFENIHSAGQFEDTLQSYIDAVNKEPGDVDIIVFYFSGYGLTGQPERLVKKRELGIFTDRVGILYDLALVMCNETLFPVAKMQVRPSFSLLSSHIVFYFFHKTAKKILQTV